VARDDWRLRIELDEEKSTHLLDRLGVVHADSDDLARELAGSRLAATHDGDTVFVYASTSLELEKARRIVERELTGLGEQPERLVTEHWLAQEERWDDDPKGPDFDEEILAEGYAPWEVRIPCKDHHAARALADQLDQEGYGIVRRWRYVIAGCASEEQAKELAERVHGTVEPGSDLVWEALHGHPFAVVGPM
jgi:hypothetical protein